MRGNEDLNAFGARSRQNLPHVFDGIVGFHRRVAEFVEFTALRKEVVVRIDN